MGKGVFRELARARAQNGLTMLITSEQRVVVASLSLSECQNLYRQGH